MTATRPVPAFAAVPVTAVAVVLAGVLTAFSGRYGFHRDELYFLVAGDHLAWGYVDQPPLTPLLAHLSTAVFGGSPAGLRVVATIAGAAIVLVVGLIAREFGSDRRAQLLAACCAAVSGFVLAVGHMVSTATFDLLAWMVITWIAIHLLRTGDGRWWLPLGVAAGIALENKYLVVLLLGALLISVLVVGPRSILRSWWLVAGVAVAAAIAAPNVWWQATHGWPQLTVAGGISDDDGTENRIMFIPLQILQLSPFLVPLGVAGLLRLWTSPVLRWARSVALAYPLLCVAVLLVGGKSYYALPLLLVLIAAGCQPTVDWAVRGRQGLRRGVVAAGLVLAAVTSAVVTLPVLPASAVNAVLAVNPEQGEQIGWPELTSAVATAWSQLPAEDRASGVIFAGNYGEAGAITEYGPSHGLPAPYSGHMSFADWGPPADTQNGPVLLVTQERNARYESHFTDCRQVGQVDNGQGVDNEEQGAVIVLCSGTTKPWSSLWPDLRRFY
jgi:4-amino-4-deoxy-L-arabinose transferase-like glycosyltransferase